MSVPTTNGDGGTSRGGASPPVAREVPVAIICGSGYRSNVVVSLLEAQGYAKLLDVAGGMDAWETAGLPEERGVHAEKNGA